QHIRAKQKYEQVVAYVIASGKFLHMAIGVRVQRKELEMDKSGKLNKVRGSDNEVIIKSIIEEIDVKGSYSNPDPMSVLII
ncbi:hypothetical protein PENTCL1PPCAC_19222, partial [Pristionchus entomophagus]